MVFDLKWPKFLSAGPGHAHGVVQLAAKTFGIGAQGHAGAGGQLQGEQLAGRFLELEFLVLVRAPESGGVIITRRTSCRVSFSFRMFVVYRSANATIPHHVRKFIRMPPPPSPPSSPPAAPLENSSPPSANFPSSFSSDVALSSPGFSVAEE